MKKENTNVQNTQNTQNTENALTLFGTEALTTSALNIAEGTFHGITVSKALVNQCKAYIGAELLERKAKIKKGIALYTIKVNGLANIYKTDENGRAYPTNKDGTPTDGASKRMFNRFMKELNIPQSTYNRLIDTAKYCCYEVDDDKTKLKTLAMPKKIEILPEAVLMYAHEHKQEIPKSMLEKFLNETEDLSFTTAESFAKRFKAFMEREAEKNGQALPTEQSTEQNTEQNAEQTTEQNAEQSTEQNTEQNAEQTTEQNADDVIPISLVGEVHYRHTIAMSISHKDRYFPVPLDAVQKIENCDDVFSDEAEKAYSELKGCVEKVLTTKFEGTIENVTATMGIRSTNEGKCLPITVMYDRYTKTEHVYINTIVDTFVIEFGGIKANRT